MFSDFKQGFKEWISPFKGMAGLTEWNPPIVESDDIHDEHRGKMIFSGDDMVDGMPLKGMEYLSESNRFFPADAFFQKGELEFIRGKPIEFAIDPQTKKKIATKWEEILLKPGKKVFYKATSIGDMGKNPRYPPIPAVNEKTRIEKANTIQSLRDKDMKLDLTMYQALLANPETNQQAVDELRELKAIIIDTGKLAEAELETKIKRTKMFSTGVGLIGTALGAATGVASVGALAAKASNVASGATQQALKLTQSITDKIGKANAIVGALGLLAATQVEQTRREVNEAKSKKLNINIKKNAVKTAYDVALKTAGLAILGVAASLNPVGGTITAIAIVTTIAKGAANIHAKKLERKELAMKMGKEDLLRTIDEMLENNGTIFYKSDNPMFTGARVLKEQVDSILNTKDDDKVMDEIKLLQNSVRAATLLDEMMTNAANKKQNISFEKEIEKSKVMEKMNNATVNTLRKRRSKLKRLFNTYKKPMLNRNMQNMLNKAALNESNRQNKPKLKSMFNKFNSTLKTRKNRR